MAAGWTELELEKRQQAMFDVVLDQIVEPMDPARAGEALKTTANRPQNAERPAEPTEPRPVNHAPKGER